MFGWFKKREMKYLILIAMLASAPAQGAEVKTCQTLADFVETVAMARDAGITKAASAAMIRQSATNAVAMDTMLKVNEFVYGSTASAGQLTMAMFNACMEN